MAITWGSAKGSGSTKFKVGVEVLAPTPSGGTATITTNVWVHTKDKVNDSSVSLVTSGNAVLGGTQNVVVNTPSNSDWSTKNRVLVAAITKTMPASGTPTALTANASVSGINSAGAGTTATATGKATLQPPAFTTPDAPTGITTTGVAGGFSLAWTNTNASSTSKPYLWVDIERWDNVKNAWYLLKTITPSASYADLSVIEDRQYRYRVRGGNTGGSSTWLTGSLVATGLVTPAAPVAKRPATNVEISWENTSSTATAYELWHKENGVLDASALATVTLPATSYTHAGASTSSSHSYALKTVRGASKSPTGAWSAVVPALLPPLSPTNLRPSGGILDAALGITLAWDHEPADGTDQTASRPRWREQGVSAWTLPSGLSLSCSSSGNLITASGHSFNVGDIVRFTGSPPSPLAVGTHYYAIPVSATTFRVASTEENAEDSIPLSLGVAGGAFSALTGRIISNVSAYSIPGGTLPPGKAWEWSVATDGRFSGVSPSSPRSVGGFRTGAKPTVTFSTPLTGDTIASPKAFVGFVFFSEEVGVTQQWASVTLWRDATLLESYESSGDWSTFQFEHNLANGETYRIEVEVEGTNGIRSAIYSSTFTAEYLGPETPGLSLTWDDSDGLVIIDITNPSDDEDAPPAASNALYRSIDGEAFTLMFANLPTGTTVVDYLPTPGSVNTYKVIAKAADGGTETYQAAVECSNVGDWYWLNGGPAFDQIAKVRYFAGKNQGFGRQKAFHEFDGRSRPMAFYGPLRNHRIELTATLPNDAEGREAKRAILALADLASDVYYRDPEGNRLRCAFDGDVEFEDQEDLIRFRATLVEVDA